MPIGYVTANQGESRYTVAIPRKTPLLAALIEARRVEIEGIDRVLEELRKHEAERRETYNAAMVAVGEATAGYTECRESYTTLDCRNAKIAAANAAYDAAMDACFDAWRDCREACDLGDGDCYDACDDKRETCEAAAEAALDNTLAAVDRLCVDAIVAHLATCQKQWAPVIAEKQAAAVEALAPLQDAMIAITWERTKRTAAVRRLNELLGVQGHADMATAWSAQYNEDIPVGAVPEEPTGAEGHAVTVATVSGRAVITEISSADPCAHDARALPADVLFVDAALAPGVETWRPTWRTGTVTAINGDGTLKVRVDPAILPGTLGTPVSRRDINCTPPGAFFDESGELDARLGIARQEYEDAIEARDEILAEIEACRAAYTVETCTAEPNQTCANNRDASLLACADSRDACLALAEDANGVQYCLDQYAACTQQVDAIFSACVDGVTADCVEAKRQHDSRCQRDRQAELTQAETEVSSALRNLINATSDIQGPPAELILDVGVGHCFADGYEVGDDILIDFPARATSAGLDWSSATSEQIRAAAMAVWQSAQVVGWASNTRQCSAFLLVAGNTRYIAQFGNGELSLSTTSKTGGYFGPWRSGSAGGVSWDANAVYRPEPFPVPVSLLAASKNFELRLAEYDGVVYLLLTRQGATQIALIETPRLDDLRGGFIYPSPNYSAFSPDETRVAIGIPASYVTTRPGVSPFREHYYGGRVYEIDFTAFEDEDFAPALVEIMGDDHDLPDGTQHPAFGQDQYSNIVAEKQGLLSVAYNQHGLDYRLWTMRDTRSRTEWSESTGNSVDMNTCSNQLVLGSTGKYYLYREVRLIAGDFERVIFEDTTDLDREFYEQYNCVIEATEDSGEPDYDCDGVGGWQFMYYNDEGKAQWKCSFYFGYHVGTNIKEIKKDHYPAIVFDGIDAFFVTFGRFDLKYDQGVNYNKRDVINMEHEKTIQAYRLEDSPPPLFSAPAEYWDDSANTDGVSAPSYISFLPYRLIQKGADLYVQQEKTPFKKYGYAKSTPKQIFFGIVDESDDHPVQAYFVVDANSATEVELPGALTKLSVGG